MIVSRTLSVIALLAAFGGVCRGEDAPPQTHTLAPNSPVGVAFTPFPAHSRDFRFITLPEINFDPDRAELNEAARKTLDIVARYIEAELSVRRVLVHGYTDKVDPKAKGAPIADRRAAAVRDYLVSHGVPIEQIALQGYGEALSTDENWTEPGRAHNRRVELYAIHGTNTPP